MKILKSLFVVAVLLMCTSFVFAQYNSLKEAVNDTKNIKEYSLNGNENVGENLGDLGGAKLTIFGNGYDIDGNGNAGISVGSGQILNIEKGISEKFIWKNFYKKGYGGIIYNSNGTVILDSAIFESNSVYESGGAIYNDCISQITMGDGTRFTNNAAECGGGIYNRYNSQITMGDNVIFSSNTTWGIGGAICNYDNSTITMGDNITFSFNFSLGSEGGAIYNYDSQIIMGNNIVFFLNLNFDYGGAIHTCGNSTITMGDNIVFSSNTAHIGGAICSGTVCNHNDSQITMGDNIVFLSNTAIADSDGHGNNGYGGAIYNRYNSQITMGDNIVFSSNTATAGSSGYDGAGGAIYNYDNSQITLGDNIVFSSNTATAGSSGYDGAGGAIYNYDNSQITMGGNIAFFSNTATKGNGGAIYNRYNSQITMGDNIVFSSNTATADSSEYCCSGGAILNNNSILAITNGAIFKYNLAQSNGGAIYNDGGIVNLIANTNNIEFTGNIANGISNAIHDYNGTINLWVSKNVDIIFNDRITSENNLSVLNINSSTTTLTANGKIILNEDMSGYTGTVNLYDGEIELQAKTNGSNINTNKFFNGDINLSSGTLNMSNGSIDNITISSLMSTINTNLKFDTNLSNNTSDNFTVTNYASGEINLTAINILGKNENNGQITLFNNSKSPTLNILTTVNYGGYEYTFTNSENPGILNYELTGIKTFKEVINDTIPNHSIRSYSLANDEILAESLGDLGGVQLTIFGNGYDVNGSSHSGITISNGQTLNIEKGTGENFSWNNFSYGTGGVFYVAEQGFLNLDSNIHFSSNSTGMIFGGAIYNNGTLNVGSDGYYYNNNAENGGAIENKGILTVSYGTKFISNDAICNGGAISNETYNTYSYPLLLANVFIANNVTFSSNTAQYGGAFSNVNATAVIGDNNIFQYNKATAEGEGGGAIYNSKDYYSNIETQMTIGSNAKFLNNEAQRLGGAIYNSYATMSIGDNSIFLQNKAFEYSAGGAINNNGTMTIGKNAIFSNNSANDGGAIFNRANFFLTDGGKFENNVSNNQGGAIFNYDGGVYSYNAVLNLTANTNNLEFTGNTANGVSNAIHDNNGTINLWASKAADIIFNDRITSSNNTSILNINQSSGTLPTAGKIVLNEDMSGYTGTVNLYGGEIELQAKPNDSNINTNKFFSGNINLSSGTLNILNGSIDNITVESLTTTANTSLKFDTDLSNNTSDNFTVTNSATGTLNLTAINILGVNELNGQITLFNNEIAPEINILTTAYYNGYKYAFTNSDILGVLNYERRETKTFKEVINENEPSIRSYSFAENETATDDLGDLGGVQLTIFGNGYEVKGSSKAGITVSNGQILSIEKGTGENFSWNNFYKDGNGGVINNNGTVEISSNVVFISNTAQAGGVIYTSGNSSLITSVNSIFVSNSATMYGGAVYNNDGTINISSTVFSSNVVTGLDSMGNGGAIYNAEGEIIISSSIFSLNKTNNGYGGAIFNNSGRLFIDSTTFSLNEVNSYSDGNGYGGAIFNDSNAVIKSSVFNFNKAKGVINNTIVGGGAICNVEGTMSISSTTFSSNEAIGNDCDGYGGAIFNKGNSIINKGLIKISSSYFVSNEAIGNNGYGYGGAIYNDGGKVIVNSTVFNSNFAIGNCGYGGAVYLTNSYSDTDSIITLMDGTSFINNFAKDDGGAIYSNGGIINLIANTANIEFTGNKAYGGRSNAIHDNGGTINMWASQNADIIFNDRITSSNNTSILNINCSTKTLTANGKIILNEDMSGYKGTVNLYGGEIELQTSSSSINTNKFFSGNINLISGTLNILNNSIDNITVSTLTTTANTNLKFDTDLSNNTSDNFTVTNYASGEINLTAINILGVNELNGQIILFNNEISPELNILTTANYNGYEYVFTNSDVAGILNYELISSTKTLKTVVNDTVPTIRSYSLAKNENLTETLEQLGGTQLTIFGNGYEINGNSNAGITISDGQTLNIEKGTGESFSWNNFNKNGSGGVINNTGILKIDSNVIFSSNVAQYGGTIYNRGNINVGSNVIFSSNVANDCGGAIYNLQVGSVSVSSNTIFTLNHVNYEGGAIKNEGYFKIDTELIFTSNTAINGGAVHNTDNGNMIIGSSTTFEKNESTASGGAINNKGILEIGLDSQFISNKSKNGGAILNNLNSSNLTIKEGATFSSNTATCGGAIYNDGLFQIDSNAIFNSNQAILFNDDLGNDGCGGAIYNGKTIRIGDNVIFSSNSSICIGGAIVNSEGVVEIGKNSKFVSNSTIENIYYEQDNQCGGAIYNDGILIIDKKSEFNSNVSGMGGAIFNVIGKVNIKDGVIFKNNEALYGGAIYNNLGTLNLIANIENIEFTGNIANGISNAIHDNGGTIFLWASNNASIIFNDRIISEDNSSTLYINTSTTTLTANGEIILNEDMSGYTGAVNLYGGEIELQAKPNSSNINTNKFFSGNINLSSGTLNILNNSIDNITVSTLTATANSNLKIDANLSNNTSDNFTVTNYANGILNLTAINILGVNENIGQITLFNNEKSPDLNVLTTGIYGGREYEFTNSDISGVLNYRLVGYKTIKEIINDTEPEIRSYSLANNETAIENLGYLGGTQLTIFGNGYEVNGSSNAGITVDNGQTLNIYKGNGEFFIWNNFNKNGLGGVIYNSGNIVIGDNVIFSSNTAECGGVIYNSGQMEIGHNVVFSYNVSSEGVASVIYNDQDGILNIAENATFNSNISSIDAAVKNLGKLIIGSNVNFYSNNGDSEFEGGAIENFGILEIRDNATFNSNKKLNYGGIICNYGTLSFVNGAKFENNISESFSGAIYNSNILNLMANTINIEFTGNKSFYGTENEVSNAIHDNNGTINLWASQNADIIFNDRITSEDSSSILNINSSTTTLTANGKIILNEDMSGYTGTVNLYNGEIELTQGNNFFDTDNFIIYGGTLSANASNILKDFENNGTVNFTGGTNNNYIFGTGTITINGSVINSSTIANAVIINAQKKLTTKVDEIIGDIENNGELVFNNNGTNSNWISGTGTTIIDGEVINSSIIANVVTINAQKKLTTNSNYVNGNITNNGILLFDSGIINDNEITGTGILDITVNNLINNNFVKQDTINISSEETVNNFISNSIISADNLNLNSINFKLTENGSLSVKNLSATNSEMNLANSILQEHNFTTITLTDDLNLSVDADLVNKKMDTISADGFSGNGKINVKAINILTDVHGKTEISFTTSTVLKDKITSMDTVNSKLFKYDVNYNKDTGNFNFLLSTKANSVIFESQVASVGNSITQTVVLNKIFSSIDNVRNRIIQAKQKRLLYASTVSSIFDNPNRIESGLWIRPFMSQDTINVDNLEIDNTLTGTLAGLDLATGENSLISLYLGYAGSNQKYENIKVNQSGYVLGATGMLVKEKWYAGITANIIFNNAQSETVYGTDSFDMNMYSVGAKAGYNFNLNQKFILESNLTLMYGNVNSNEYETKQGAKIDAQSTANIMVEPQLIAKLDLSNGWQPYGLFGYVMNSGEKTKLVASDVVFDDMGISGYVEYGLGVNKTFINSPWSCYLQVTGKSGDISGFDGNIGIKYSFLNKQEKENIELAKYMKKKEKEKQAKQKALEEEQKKIEEEKKTKLEAEEKARIEEEKRLEKIEREKQKAIEEEIKRKEREEKEKLEAEEKARIKEEKRLKKIEQEKQRKLEEEKFILEQERQEREKMLELQRKIQENYN